MNGRIGGSVSALLVLILILLGCGVGALTSEEFLSAVTIADLDLSLIPDGTYQGEYTIITPPGVYAAYRHAAVRVEITGGGYSSITIEEPSQLADDPDYIALLRDIENRDDLNAVDDVSGATYSSRALRKAVEAAVLEASP